MRDLGKESVKAVGTSSSCIQFVVVLLSSMDHKSIVSVTILLIILLEIPALANQQQATNESVCLYWAHYNRESNKCECASDLFGIVNCRRPEGGGTEMNVSIIYGYCMTLDSQQNKAVVGACPYHHMHCPPTCKYHLVSRNITTVFCGRVNRVGQLCGECMDGYSPPVFSYYPQCVRCSPGTNNWLKYLIISFSSVFPFLVAIALFRFSALAPQVTGYIFACQILTSPILIRTLVHNHKRVIDNKAELVMYFLCGLWNLDAFSLIYTPFCLHPRASMLHVLSLNYLTALFPLFLIIFTYTLVRLHYNGFRVVVWLCTPFICCFARCRRQWDIRNSLVDAFATFLLLSYVNISSVSLDLLTPTFLWNSRAELEDVSLYYDGTVQFFGKTHLPYALLALTILLLFSILPVVLLCLYPCHCFQRLLNRLHCNSTALHFFMNSFQGCFKDGTDGTRDCRWFSALYLLLRLVMHFGFIVCNNFFSTFVLTLTLLGMIVLLATIQPYKKQKYTKIDIIFLATMCLAVNSAWELHGKGLYSLSTYIDKVYILLEPVLILYPLSLLLCYALQLSRNLQMRCFKNLQLFFTFSTTSKEKSALLKMNYPSAFYG